MGMREKKENIEKPEWKWTANVSPEQLLVKAPTSVQLSGPDPFGPLFRSGLTLFARCQLLSVSLSFSLFPPACPLTTPV